MRTISSIHLAASNSDVVRSLAQVVLRQVRVRFVPGLRSRHSVGSLLPAEVGIGAHSLLILVACRCETAAFQDWVVRKGSVVGILSHVDHNRAVGGTGARIAMPCRKNTSAHRQAGDSKKVWPVALQRQGLHFAHWGVDATPVALIEIAMLCGAANVTMGMMSSTLFGRSQYLIFLEKRRYCTRRSSTSCRHIQ